MYKIGICGHFGENKNLLNGQTIKTKVLTEELKKELGLNSVKIVDTYGWKSNPITLFINCFCLIRDCKNIIILPAYNGIKVLVPLFLILNKLFQKKLHYVVIGGWLPEMLDKKKLLRKKISQFDGVYVETYSMQKKLKSLGLYNVKYLPNFKRLKILQENELVYTTGEPYKLCTFSRVMKEKGIEDAIEAVKYVNETLDRKIYTLDIYGQIEENYCKRFEDLKRIFPDYIVYKGVVEFDESVDVIKEYFALLFPTYYEGEGFAGTILDAFAAGVPVIASDWKYNSEIVKEGENGYLFGSNDLRSLTNVLITAANNPSYFNKLKIKCIDIANYYSPQNTIKVLLHNL